MASRWFYRAFDQELGPVGFQGLAEMIRAGTLTEDDRVKREFSEDWVAARDVIGLLRAARSPPAEVHPVESKSAACVVAQACSASQLAESLLRAESSPQATSAATRRRPRFGVIDWILIGIAVADVFGMMGYGIWTYQQSRVFPEPKLRRPQPADFESFKATGPARKVPSAPGQRDRTRKVVSGPEAVGPGSSLSLTPDLETIVCLAVHRGNGVPVRLTRALR